MLLNVAKDVYFTTTLNNTLCTECFKPFCRINHCLKFFSKASRLLFIFIRTGHAQFSNNKIHISLEPDKPTLVFFSCIVPKISYYESQTQCLWQVTMPTFWFGKKKLPSSQSLLVQSALRVHSLVHSECIH